MKFQFQLGAIGSKKMKTLKIAAVVSIPAWCDWEKLVVLPPWPIDSFNSSLVRLGESNVSRMDILYECFNSSLVRLGVPCYPFPERTLVVSIPVWGDWELPAVLQ